MTARLAATGFIVAAAAAAVFFASRPDLPGWASLALFAGALLAGAVAAGGALFIAAWLDQRSRDLVAQAIWERVANGAAPPPFCLYLRPFASTDALAGDAAAGVVFETGAGRHLAVLDERFELEAVVEEALRPIGPLVTLGRPLDHLGAGRIDIEEDGWHEAVAALARAARLIALLPSSRPGTLWEVETLIASDALEKTVIIDPPAQDRPTADGYDSSAEWDAVRAAFAAARRRLPPDDPDGLIAAFDRFSREPRTAPFPLHQPYVLTRFAKTTLKRAVLPLRAA